MPEITLTRYVVRGIPERERRSVTIVPDLHSCGFTGVGHGPRSPGSLPRLTSGSANYRARRPVNSQFSPAAQETLRSAFPQPRCVMIRQHTRSRTPAQKITGHQDIGLRPNRTLGNRSSTARTDHCPTSRPRGAQHKASGGIVQDETDAAPRWSLGVAPPRRSWRRTEGGGVRRVPCRPQSRVNVSRSLTRLRWC